MAKFCSAKNISVDHVPGHVGCVYGPCGFSGMQSAMATDRQQAMIIS